MKTQTGFLTDNEKNNIQRLWGGGMKQTGELNQSCAAIKDLPPKLYRQPRFQALLEN